ncbi:MAG TPA: hypothetical protein VHA52_12180 [Candidatus Babeliaceae bacterium]|nr:hypothetical protein [Candidatus Babeliaceae bacterium]
MTTLLDEFNQRKHEYAEYCEKLHNLINSILKSENVNAHQITVRVKESDSFKRKIENKQGKYTSLSDITDIVGLRIITYFEDDVDVVSKIIEREFNIDHENSIDKRNFEIDKFGYKSLHYVITLSDSRNKLLEYKKFSSYKAEVQIRSILQHSWAEIEHDLGYKSKFVIPDVAKRSFYRISALLEVADIEFVNLKKLLTAYKEEVKSQIADDPNRFTLDQDTLLEFMSSNKLFKHLEEEIASITKLPVTGTYGELSISIETFKEYEINTIEDLINALNKYSKLILAFAPALMKHIKASKLGKAISIHSLAEILQLENNNESLYKYYGKNSTFLKEAKKILNSVNK